MEPKKNKGEVVALSRNMFTPAMSSDWVKSKTLGDRKCPDRRHFTATPKFAPTLRDNIRQLAWDAVKGVLLLNIEENEEFGAFSWFMQLNERKQKVANSPVKNLEEETLVVQFVDLQKKPLTGLVFTGLELVTHETDLDADALPDGVMPVVHRIRLKYDECHRTMSLNGPDDRDLFDWKKGQYSVVDEEWKRP